MRSRVEFGNALKRETVSMYNHSHAQYPSHVYLHVRSPVHLIVPFDFGRWVHRLAGPYWAPMSLRRGPVFVRPLSAFSRRTESLSELSTISHLQLLIPFLNFIILSFLPGPLWPSPSYHSCFAWFFGMTDLSMKSVKTQPLILTPICSLLRLGLALSLAHPFTRLV